MNCQNKKTNQGEQNKAVGNSHPEINYYVYYTSNSSIKKISRTTFININGKTIVQGNSKIRVVGAWNKQFKRALSTFRGESMFDTLFGAVDGMRLVIDILNKLSTVKHLCKTSVFLSVSNILLSFKSLSDAPSVVGFLKLVVELYTLKEVSFEGQSSDGILLAGISMFLPSALTELLRRASLFTNVKVVDDLGLYHSMVTWFSDILKYLLSFLEKILPSNFYNYFQKFLNLVNITKHHSLLEGGKKLLLEYTKNPRVISNEIFRKKVIEFNKSLQEDLDFFSWARRNAGVSHVIEALVRLGKVAQSYGEMGRQEPVCFIFEGPPGTLKSYTMLPLIESMNKSAYVHIVKSVEDGKDFYDSYNNEEIFYMDDVGQQGISQWRMIINMVSPVKLPLDCADAKLKDTKNFSSDIIFLTTNCFSNIQGLTKQDCISDIKALWRRGYVFDFAQAKNVNGRLAGSVAFKYFDIHRNTFVENFPPDLNSLFVKKNIILPPKFVINEDTTRVDLLKWMKTIVDGFCFLRKSFRERIPLSQSEKEFLSENLFEGETGSSSDESGSISEDEFFDSETIVTRKNFCRLQDIISTRDDSLDENAPILDIAYKNQLSYVLGFIGIDNFNFSPVGFFNVCKEFFLSKLKSFWDGFVAVFRSILDNPILTHLSILALSYSLVMGCFYLFTYYFLGNVEFKGETHVAFQEVHTGVSFVQKNVKYCEIYPSDDKNERIVSRCLVSGRKIILPSHAVGSPTVYIKVFNDDSLKNILIDLEKCTVVLRSEQEDTCVLSLPNSYPSPFKSVASHCDFNTEPIKYWLGDTKILDYGKIKVPYTGSVTYTVPGSGLLKNRVIKNTLLEENRALYTERGSGVCGSVIVDERGNLKGMHVAGSEVISAGCAVLWSSNFLRLLKETLKETYNVLDFSQSEKPVTGSYVKLDANLGASVPTKTNFGPSPLYGVYPISRSPANLQHSGKCTVKDVCKKSLQPCEFVAEEELKYAMDVCKLMLVPFGKMTEKEIVKGNENLAGLNKDSSNGFGCLKEKSAYVDFEKGELTPFCRQLILEFEENIKNGKIDWEKLVWVETLKDELRSDEKQGEPRSFRVGTIINQILTKKYFGKFVEHIVTHRDENEIMIGCNPFRDWDGMYQRLVKSKGVFAGDVKKWDGKMSPQVQRSVLDLIVSFMSAEDREIGSILIESIFRSIVSIQDDVILTTHSMSSGSFLTAILNSFVHRFYTAMWFYREWKNKFCKKPTPGQFSENIIDYLYGDDSVNAIKNSNLLSSHNALTMRDFYQSLGMDLTTSSKDIICKPFDDIEEITFLKRKFVYHNKIGRVMCPLDLVVLQSGLSWVDYSKDIWQVMYDKMHNYQREIYLHPDRKALCADFLHRVSELNVVPPVLTENYLYNLYTTEVESLKEHYSFSYF